MRLVIVLLIFSLILAGCIDSGEEGSRVRQDKVNYEEKSEGNFNKERVKSKDEVLFCKLKIGDLSEDIYYFKEEGKKTYFIETYLNGIELGLKSFLVEEKEGFNQYISSDYYKERGMDMGDCEWIVIKIDNSSEDMYVQKYIEENRMGESIEIGLANISCSYSEKEKGELKIKGKICNPSEVVR